MPLWLAAKPLMLASKSAARRAVLEAAGIPIELRSLPELGLRKVLKLLGF